MLPQAHLSVWGTFILQHILLPVMRWVTQNCVPLSSCRQGYRKKWPHYPGNGGQVGCGAGQDRGRQREREPPRRGGFIFAGMVTAGMGLLFLLFVEYFCNLCFYMQSLWMKVSMPWSLQETRSVTIAYWSAAVLRLEHCVALGNEKYFLSITVVLEGLKS